MKNIKLKTWHKRLIFIAAGAIVLFIVAIVGFITSVNMGAFGKMYSKKELQNFQNEIASQVYSEDSVLIGKYFDQNRTHVKYEQLPEHVVNALIATEDARFFEHGGVDTKSILRVAIKSILFSDKSSGGGSTITQQLAKNMFGRENHGILSLPVNKVKEMLLASKIEEMYSKEEIITMYLNTIPFGENVYGIGSAAKRFFNKTVSELKPEEGAILVGMLKANTYYNPRLHPENAVKRRNVVLSQMEKYGYLDQEAADTLTKLPLVMDYANLEAEGPANYFMVWVKKEANKILKELNEETDTTWDIEKSGLIVHTTLNYQLQLDALEAFKEHLGEMQKRLDAQYKSARFKSQLDNIAERELKRLGLTDRKDELQKQELFSWDGFHSDSISKLDSIKQALTLLHAGLLGVDPQTGAVKTWVGGIDFRTHPYDQVLVHRQLASTFKPLLYAASLEDGKMPCDYLDNDAVTLKDFEGWNPENYDETSGGKYSLAASLANSMNIPTVRLLFELGYEKVNNLWQKMGFTEDLENEPALALGIAEASVFELASAYAAFANGGHPVQPFYITSITTQDGEVLYEHKSEKSEDQVLSDKTTSLMNAILQKAINEGTGTSMRTVYSVQFPLAGKTGTSQDYSDAWFVGYNPSLLMVSRVGASLPVIRFNSGANGSGSTLALPLVARTLQKAQQNDTLRTEFSTAFAALPEEYAGALDCSDFVEDGAVEKFFDLFKKKETTLEKEQKRAQRKKNNPIKKIFGKKDKNSQ
ncbi:transglycosylase domain-containing protein [Chondrinema litorale]|uniref:transglycosylase domain-containing protein n=1 Tax=Chondrinema litorale TaxID=2994555 RepID=UPI002543EB54|nr:transglycosylase domain-containing protein [Chondrinema litorale]UZR99264.1 transglycosylase domain-containing protein [Chondrinema litorale]